MARVQADPRPSQTQWDTESTRRSVRGFPLFPRCLGGGLVLRARLHLQRPVWGDGQAGPEVSEAGWGLTPPFCPLRPSQSRCPGPGQPHRGAQSCGDSCFVFTKEGEGVGSPWVGFRPPSRDWMAAGVRPAALLSGVRWTA